jgi:Holliday junction DNA helicase RuvA
MIAYIHGSLSYKSSTQIIIDVGGIGYEVHISLYTYENLKEESSCKVFTYSHITQDAHILYGFASMEEKQWFLQLLSVNGIGPRVAITILSTLTPASLQQAIVASNIAALQAIKGIGQKAAQRIILELQGKIGKVGSMLTLQPAGQEAIYQEALAALAKLGMHKTIAEKTVASILKEYQGEITVESLIKLALKG